MYGRPLEHDRPTETNGLSLPAGYRIELPAYWGKRTRWVKGDMVASVSFQRVDLLRVGKDAHGKRLYQTQTLPKPDLERVLNCVLRSLGI